VSIETKEIILEFEKAGTAKGIVKRYLAPLTVERFMKKLPIFSTANLIQGIIFIPVDLMIGFEKSKNSIKERELFYIPQNKAIGISFKNYNKLPFKVNPMGEVTNESLYVLNNIRRGERVKILLKNK